MLPGKPIRDSEIEEAVADSGLTVVSVRRRS
jgi:hypothetical protein